MLKHRYLFAFQHRRVNQRYLVATSTKLDISKVSVPENINDKYFAR